MAAACLLVACGGDRIVVGGKNFTEQDILAELVAQQIERATGLPVERRFHLGGTLVCHRALTAGELDVYVEYSGTAYTTVMGQPTTVDSDSVLRLTTEEYRARWNLEWLPPLGFENTFALIVRPDDAERLGLRTISDLAPHASTLTAGFGFEFNERPDGYAGLAAHYGFRFGEVRTMDLGLLYRALTEERVDVAVGNSTDGLIDALGLVVLEDDRRYFPPYHAAPVARGATLERHPAVREALVELGGRLTNHAMRRLNYEVDGRRRAVAEVVREWLETQ